MPEPISGYTTKQQQALMKIGEGIVEFWQASGQVPESPERRLLERHGELVSLATAGKILGRSPVTIRTMAEDGRLRRAADGKILVSSIAAYLEAPEQHDYTARIRRRGRKQKPILVPSKQKAPGEAATSAQEQT